MNRSNNRSQRHGHLQRATNPRNFATIAALIASLLIATTLAFADEGMWLYNSFPTEKVKAKYGFAPTPQWLDRVRLSSVRFNNGGSGSFVSLDGLTVTNHHVGAECLQQLSVGGKDYLKTGFRANSLAEEAKCPDLELNQLLAIEDVTSQVNAAVQPEMSVAEAGHARRSAMSGIEKNCANSTGRRCDVVTLYAGAVYNLYEYKRYTDVRVVFAPEFDAAFFGGDPDNFNYPRFDLDVTFFRVYENGKPVHLDNYLHWSRTGVKEGDLIFVSGHPGSTDRLKTVAQLETLRDVIYPKVTAMFARRIATMQKFAAVSDENARISKEDLFGYQNAFKAISGSEQGLQDQALMAAKVRDERELRAQIVANTKLSLEIGDPWAAIAKAEAVANEIFVPFFYLERGNGFNSDLARDARTLVRVAVEKTKPNGERLREYVDSGLPSLEQRLFSTAPVYKSLETVTLADSLAQMWEALGANDPTMQKILGGKSPETVAKSLIDGTRLDEVAVRKQLYEGGTAAIDASTDPLIVLMRNMDPGARAVRKRSDDEVDAVERQEGAKIAKARFSETGFSEAPDATFTLRLAFGVVKPYTWEGKQVPYFTTFAGAFTHGEEHGNAPPYNLPQTWFAAKSKLNLGTPLNFVTTADTIGGNSGSPLVNTAGEFVGINFDRNMQAISRNFFFDDKAGRNVSVDATGIQEALRKIYDARALADELLTGSMQGGRAR